MRLRPVFEDFELDFVVDARAFFAPGRALRSGFDFDFDFGEGVTRSGSFLPPVS